MPGLPTGQRTIHEMLPGPIRKLAEMVYPSGDPTTMMPVPGGLGTTIGPKAIPLGDTKGYMNRVLKSSLEDVIQPPASVANLGKAQHVARTVLPDESLTDPSALEHLINLFAKAYTTGPFNK